MLLSNYNQPGTSTLQTNISGVGNAYFIYSNGVLDVANMETNVPLINTYLTSWTIPTVGGTTTYKAFAIGAGSVTQLAPVSGPTMSEWGMIVFVLLAGLSSAYYLRKQKKTGR